LSPDCPPGRFQIRRPRLDFLSMVSLHNTHNKGKAYLIKPTRVMKFEHALYLFAGSFLLIAFVIAATPVGGWHPSHPYASDYKMFFCISLLSCVACGFLLVDAFKRDK
jgi:hypothetical protein